MGEHLLGIDRVARVVLRDALGQRHVEGLALVVIELVELVSPDRDEIRHGSLGQLGGLVEDEAAVSYTGFQREHDWNVAHCGPSMKVEPAPGRRS
ncbi:hypothetical protein WMF38_45045 [Sorangium sp. So ce118]